MIDPNALPECVRRARALSYALEELLFHAARDENGSLHREPLREATWMMLEGLAEAIRDEADRAFSIVSA